MKELYIHLGLHKTGTTYLQKHIFPQFKSINFPCEPDKIWKLYEGIRKGTYEPPDGKTLISVNKLSGFPYNTDVDYNHATKYDIINDIWLNYYNAKIIIVTRNSKAWISSCYNQYLKEGGVLGFKAWFYKRFDFDYLNGEYINYIKHRFKDVLILDYAEFKSNPVWFIDKIRIFMGIHDSFKLPNIIENKSYSKNELRLIRLFNILGKKGMKNPIRIQKGR